MVSPVVVQRAEGDPSAVDEDASESEVVPGTASSPPTGVSSTASGPGTTMPGAASPIADRDLDEMVRRLYPRLRRSLSSELLVARERAGTLADLR